MPYESAGPSTSTSSNGVDKLQRIKLHSPSKTSEGNEPSISRKLPIFIDSGEEDEDDDIDLPVVKEERGKKSSYDMADFKVFKVNEDRSSSGETKIGGAEDLRAKDTLRIALSKLDTEVSSLALLHRLTADAWSDQIGGRAAATITNTAFLASSRKKSRRNPALVAVSIDCCQRLCPFLRAAGKGPG